MTRNLTVEYELSSEKLIQNAKRTRWTGIASIVIGVLAIILPNVFTIAFEIIFGAFLLVGGLLQIINALSYRGNKDWGIPLFVGLLFATLGALMLFNPFKGAATLTVIIAAVFFVTGMIRIIHGVQMRGMRGTGFSVLNGMLGILIAILVFAAWPDSSMWLIGILIAIDFLILGFWLIHFASVLDKATSR